MVEEPQSVDAMLDALTDSQLLAALNHTLANRQTLDTAEQVAEREQAAADLEYRKYFPRDHPR